MNNQYDMTEDEINSYPQLGDAAYVHKCKLCEERDAELFESPITGLPQYCHKCLK